VPGIRSRSSKTRSRPAQAARKQGAEINLWLLAYADLTTLIAGG
jgi:hypothetical protein